MTDLTEATIASFSGDPRTHQLVTRLVAHLHAYAREVDLTFDEWRHAIDFLTRAGHMSGPARQELIMLSDVLGLSMLVEQIAHRDPAATDATVLGPFYVGEHRPFANGASIAEGMTGEPLVVTATVRDAAGDPIAGATADVWHADAEGFYDSQKGTAPSLRGRFTTNARGTLSFRTIVPCSYPVPTDGPVGELLHATGRHPMRPAHIHFYLRAAGKAPLVTHVFVAGDAYLTSDAVFGVRPSLIAPIVRDAAGTNRLSYDFVLGGAA